MPGGVVGILNRQLLERRRFAGGKGPVKRPEFAQKYAARPAVNRDVMGRDQQKMILLSQRQQPETPEGPLAQIERRAGFLDREPRSLGHPARGRYFPEINSRQRQRLGGSNSLARSAVNFRKHRPHGFVA